MALDIIIFKNAEIPYWEDVDAFRFGAVDPFMWEALFYQDLGIKTVNEFREENPDESYDAYYAKTFSAIRQKFPFLSRLEDYYEDALFSSDEILALLGEVAGLIGTDKFAKSKPLLVQLLTAAEKARDMGGGIRLVAD